eukprot:TRINITY_DN933_c0_g1_i4.p1 TRINITY_DN933_c0_g1~~TRINITY_DN933_c0_g1_i4.p1  ORF type:complete len:167 (-),score=40.94 TRINITY_DN933_c0_g1_i4:36-536(-)
MARLQRAMTSNKSPRSQSGSQTPEWKRRQREQEQAAAKKLAMEQQLKQERIREAEKEKQEEQILLEKEREHQKQLLESLSSAGNTIEYTFLWPYSYDFDDVVSLHGSFTDGKSISMVRNDTFEYQLILNLPPGEHYFRFNVNGTWKHDPKLKSGFFEGNMCNKVDL